MKEPTLVLVVPCHNEARRLQAAPWLAWIDHTPWANLLFVDDGSADATPTLLASLAEAHPRVHLLRLPRNVGKGEAVRRGLLFAFTLEPDHVGYWDADLATPLDAVGLLRDRLILDPALWLVMGARVKLLGSAIQRHGTRHYAGRIAATLASLVLGLPVYDTQCGAKLLRVGAPVRSACDAPFLTSWTFDVELIGRLRDQVPGGVPEVERRLHEVALPTWVDIGGSHIGWLDVLRAPWDLLRIGCHRRRTRATRARTG